MTVRRVTQHNMLGGLSSAISDRMTSPNRWLDAQNMIICDPIGASNTTASDAGVVTTPFQNSRIKNYSNSYIWGDSPALSAYPLVKPISTFETSDYTSEIWSGDTGYDTTTAISEGDKAGRIRTNTSGSSDAVSANGAFTAFSLADYSGYYLVLDTQWTGVANFASGYIRIGSDAAHYYQWNITAPASDGKTELRYSLASPDANTTPVTTAIDYAYISITSSAGQVLTFVFDNLRLQNYAASTGAGLSNMANIRDKFFYEYSSGNILEIYRASNTLYLHSNLAQDVIRTNIPTTYNMYGFVYPDVTGSKPYNGVFYYTDGVGGIFTYNYNAAAGSRHSRVGSEAYRYIAVHKSIVFAARTTTYPMKMAPSDVFATLGATLTWDSVNEITIPTSVPGEYITGLYPMDDYLVITTNARIWTYWGTLFENGDVSLRKSASRVGCVEQSAGCVAGGKLYFYSGDGVYEFDGNDSRLVSGPITDKLNTGVTNSWVRLAYYQERNVLLVAFPYSVTDPISSADYTSFYTYTMHIPTLAWGVFNGLSTRTNVNLGFVAYTGRIDFFGAASGSYDVQGYTGETMPAYITTAFNACGRPGVDKDFQHARLFVDSSDSITTTAYSNYSTSTEIQTASLTPANKRIDLLLSGSYGESQAFKIYKSSLNSMTIAGYELEYSDAEEL